MKTPDDQPNDHDQTDDQADDEPGYVIDKMFDENRHLADQQGVWVGGGKQKDKLIGKLIKLSAKFVNCQISHDSSTNSEIKQYTPLPDAASAANELRKILEKSDNADTRDLTILLSSYNIVRSQLLPLLHVSVNDGLTSRFCLRVISQLLIPMSEKTIRAAKHAFREKIGKEKKEESASRINTEQAVKKNAMQQISSLLSFKEAFSTDEVILVTTCQSLVGPLMKTEAERSNTDNQMIETVLHVISNLLAITALPSCCSRNEMYKSLKAHNDLIKMFQGTIIKLLVTFCESINELIFKDNMNFFLDIVANLYRGHDGKDLFKLWRQGATISMPMTMPKSNTVKPMWSAAAGQPTSRSSDRHSTNASHVAKAHGSGSLRNQLKSEQINRKELLSVKNSKMISGRNNRCTGLYAVPIPTPSTVLPSSSSTSGDAGASTASMSDFAGRMPPLVKSEPNEEDSTKVAPTPLSSFIVTNPFASVAEHLPQGNLKNQKKNQTYAIDEEDIHQIALPENDVTLAASVVTGFVEEFSKKAFDKLVTLVKEDLRRDENRVGTLEELQYFRVCSTTLKYHRLKVIDKKKNSQLVCSVMAADEGSSWPDIKCMMPALDKMSFFRVISAIKRLSSPLEKRFEVVMVPVQTYKEMLGYLYMMLQSTNEAFHELAVAALFMLFYVSSERLDPLPQLLRDWKPGTYTRRHSHLLVELVHETMKLLDLARDTFVNRKVTDRKKEKEVDIERYISAALKFDVAEYFRRLVTNATVRFYTRMIADYKHHSIQSRHYVQSFIRRLSSQGVMSEEDQNEDNVRNFNAATSAANLATSSVESSFASSANTTAASNSMIATPAVTLAYMLFNIQTLIAISLVLNDVVFCKDPDNALFIRVLKSVVRSFGEAAEKNKLLFVESLFQHSHPHRFCSQIDNIYDATAIAAGFQRASSNKSKNMMKDSDMSESEPEFDSDASDEQLDIAEPHIRDVDNVSKMRDKKLDRLANRKTEADPKVWLGNIHYNKKFELGDEFDENDLFETVSGNDGNGTPKAAAPLRKLKSKSKLRKTADVRTATLGSLTGEHSPHPSPPMNAPESTKGSRNIVKKKSGRQWSDEDDRALREQFALYVGTYSMYDMIADHFANNSAGGAGSSFTVKHIRRRVKELKLGMTPADVDDNDGSTVPSSGDRKLEEEGSDESEDEDPPPAPATDSEDNSVDPSIGMLVDELHQMDQTDSFATASKNRSDPFLEDDNFRKWLRVPTPGSEVSVHRKRLYARKTNDGDFDEEEGNIFTETAVSTSADTVVDTFLDTEREPMPTQGVGASLEDGCCAGDVGGKRKIDALGDNDEIGRLEHLTGGVDPTELPEVAHAVTYGKRRPVAVDGVTEDERGKV